MTSCMMWEVPPEGMVETTMRNGGHLTVRGQSLDLRPAYRETLQSLAGRVATELQRAWGDHLDYLAALLVAGGGGAEIAPHLGLPGVRVVGDAMYANAAGFLQMLGSASACAQSGFAAR